MEAIATIRAIQTGWVHPTINNVSTLHSSTLVAVLARQAPACTASHSALASSAKRHAC